MTHGSGKTIRHYPCFIEAFSEAAKGYGIPPKFVHWAAIHAVAVALGRDVRGINGKGITWPNLFILFVAPPTTGKSLAELLVGPFLGAIGAKLSAQVMSGASMLDELANAEVPALGENLQFNHSLTILSSEFGQTFPGYDTEVFAKLSYLWDCPEVVRERKRSQNKGEPIVIDRVCLNMLAGVQPTVLTGIFPQSAWTGGFLTRTIFAYEPMPKRLALRPRPGDDTPVTVQMDEETRKKLEADLMSIAQMHGLMDEGEGYAEEYYNWLEKDREEPAPHHPQLFYYNGRREHLIEKLSIISAASRGSMTMIGRDYLRARSWLEDTERNLDDMFLELTQTEDKTIMVNLNHYVWRETMRKGVKALTGVQIREYISSQVPMERVDMFLEQACKHQYLAKGHAKGGIEVYAPMTINKME